MVPVNDPPLPDSSRQPMQQRLPASSESLHELKQHMLRSLAVVGIRYPIQAGASCFCAIFSNTAFRPAAAEISWIFAFVTFGFWPTQNDAAHSQTAMRTISLRMILAPAYLFNIS